MGLASVTRANKRVVGGGVVVAPVAPARKLWACYPTEAAAEEALFGCGFLEAESRKAATALARKRGWSVGKVREATEEQVRTVAARLRVKKRRARWRRYNASQKGKARQRRYDQSPKGRASKQRRAFRGQPFGTLYLHMRMREAGIPWAEIRAGVDHPVSLKW